MSRMRSQEGFTIIEALVAVGLVAILAAIAIPNYVKFSDRAKLSEARAKLGGIYAAEKTYRLQAGTYTGCIAMIGGTQPEQKSYYAAGFNFGSLASDQCGILDSSGVGQPCSIYKGWKSSPTACTPADTYTPANAKSFGGVTIIPSDSMLGSTAGDVKKNTFTARAVGNISSSRSIWDRWTIDQDKNFLNPNPGL